MDFSTCVGNLILYLFYIQIQTGHGHVRQKPNYQENRGAPGAPQAPSPPQRVQKYNKKKEN